MRAVFVLALAVLLPLSGCTRIWPWSRGDRPLHDDNPPGTWHVVKKGDSLLQIALDADVPLQDLMEINGIDDADALFEGQILYVLRPASGATAAPVTRGTATASTSPNARRTPSAHGKTSAANDGGVTRLRWPLDAPRISSPFGKRWGRAHEGIDLAAPTGTPVKAADAGQVLYAGDAIRGYGNMVVLSHTGKLVTVYAHNSVLLVRRGDRVTRGQTIARVGQSGRATGPHLHFEVRDADVPRDPIRYLPRVQ